MRHLVRIFMLAAGLLAITVAPQSARETPQGADASAIKTLHEQYGAALNAQDPGRLASFYTTDAIYMNVNSPGLIGRDAIRTNFENGLKNQTIRDAVSTSAEAQVAGNWAFDRGKFTYTAVPKTGGQPTKSSLIFLQILEKQTDGSWRIKRRTFHSDQPPASQ